MTALQPPNLQLTAPNPIVGASLLAKAVYQLTNIFRSHSIPVGAGLPAITA